MSPLWRKTTKPHTRLKTEQNSTSISATGFLCHLRHIARHRLDIFPSMFATGTSAPANGETEVSPNTPFLSSVFFTQPSTQASDALVMPISLHHLTKRVQTPSPDTYIHAVMSIWTDKSHPLCSMPQFPPLRKKNRL